MDETSEKLEETTLGKASRISEAIELVKARRQVTQKEYADKLGVSAQAITSWKKTGRISMIYLMQLCDDSGLELSYILTGEKIHGDMTGDGGTTFLYASLIPLLDSNNQLKKLGRLSFPSVLINELSQDPEDLALCTVPNDSMSPTLKDKEHILIDLSANALDVVQSGHIYAIVYPGKMVDPPPVRDQIKEDIRIINPGMGKSQVCIELKERPTVMVKRLYKQEFGGLKLVSDNSNIAEPLLLSKDEAEDVRVVGRVVWRSGAV